MVGHKIYRIVFLVGLSLLLGCGETEAEAAFEDEDEVSEKDPTAVSPPAESTTVPLFVVAGPSNAEGNVRLSAS